MESWERRGIKVNPMHHWPGETNVADLGTKGRAESQDVVEGSNWQSVPESTRYPVEQWPISRDFVCLVPEEEKHAAIFGVHATLRARETVGNVNNVGPSEIELVSMKTVSRLFEVVNSVMARTNHYEKARRVLARLLTAQRKPLPAGDNRPDSRSVSTLPEQGPRPHVGGRGLGGDSTCSQADHPWPCLRARI